MPTAAEAPSSCRAGRVSLESPVASGGRTHAVEKDDGETDRERAFGEDVEKVGCDLADREGVDADQVGDLAFAGLDGLELDLLVVLSRGGSQRVVSDLLGCVVEGLCDLGRVGPTEGLGKDLENDDAAKPDANAPAEPERVAVRD